MHVTGRDEVDAVAVADHLEEEVGVAQGAVVVRALMVVHVADD